MHNQPKILAWFEDPGALNFLDPVLENFGIPEVLRFNEGERTLRDTSTPPEKIDRILNDFNPDMVLVGTSFNATSTGLTLIEKARIREIMCVGCIDARMNAHKRFSGGTGNPLQFAPDWLLVPDRWTKNAFEKIGFNASRVIACGHPHYDRVRDEYLKLKNSDRRGFAQRTFPGSKETDQIVLFAAEPFDDAVSDKAVTSRYSLEGTSGSGNRNRITLEEFLVAVRSLEARPYLVLRPHPRSSEKELAPYFQYFDHVSKGIEPSLEVIFASDLVVGSTSMFLLETVIMRRKVLSILPREEEKNLLPVLEYELVPYCTQRKELIEKFKNILNETYSVDDFDLDEIFFFGATDRVYRILVDLLEGGMPVQEDFL